MTPGSIVAHQRLMVIGLLPASKAMAMVRQRSASCGRMCHVTRRGSRAGPWAAMAAVAVAALRLRHGEALRRGAASRPWSPMAARARSDVALLLARGRGLERQRARVDAVPLAGRPGTIVEDVTKVAAAATAHDLGAPHEQAVVRPQLDRLGGRGLAEARPAGAGVELGVRAEQPGATAGAPVEAVPVVAQVRTSERHLGMRLTQHVVLQWSQFLAPLLVRLGDLAGGGCPGTGTRPAHGPGSLPSRPSPG